MTNDPDPLNLKGMIAHLLGEVPSAEETNETIERRITTARALWYGDDTDAKVARELLDGCEACFKAITSHGAISQMLHRALTPIMKESMETVDKLAHLGIVRTTAQGRPTPDKPEWLTQDEPEQ